MISLRSLEILEKVVSCGTMVKAAGELYISQSAVSQAIDDIERTYHIRLFDRIGKKLYLTDTGAELLTYARQILQCQNSMESWLQSASSQKCLRIGATLTIGTSLLWEILDKFQTQNPDVELNVTVANTHTVEAMLLQAQLDLGLVEGQIQNRNLVSYPAIADRMVLVCGRRHPFWGRENISLADLEGQPLILREEGSGTREQIIQPLKQHNISYKLPCTCCNVESIKEAILHNYGLTYISERLVEREIAQGQMWSCRINDLENGRTFSLSWLQHKHLNDTARSLIRLCFAPPLGLGLPDGIT